jgi:hypothetical protein
MKARFLLVAILPVLSLTNCSREEWSGRIYKQNGAIIVENSGKGMWGDDVTARLTFVNELSIGRESGEDYLMFRNDLDITTDSAGNIYVLDMGNLRVVKFNDRGKLVLVIGRPGQGPGELQRPLKVIVNGRQQVFILDSYSALHFYDSGGLYQRTYRMAAGIEGLQLMEDDGFFARVQIPQQTGLRGAFYSNDLKLERGFPAQYPYGPKIPGAGNVGGDIRYLKNNIFMVLPDKYEIRIYDLEGNLLKKIRRDLVFDPPVVKRTERGGFALGGRTKLGPCFLDMHGRIINEVFQIKGSSEKDLKLIFSLDFFNPDGKFLGSYVLPEWTKLVTIDSENRFYFVTLDPFPRVIRSRLQIR